MRLAGRPANGSGSGLVRRTRSTRSINGRCTDTASLRPANANARNINSACRGLARRTRIACSLAGKPASARGRGHTFASLLACARGSLFAARRARYLHFFRGH